MNCRPFRREFNGGETHGGFSARNRLWKVCFVKVPQFQGVGRRCFWMTIGVHGKSENFKKANNLVGINSKRLNTWILSNGMLDIMFP